MREPSRRTVLGAVVAMSTGSISGGCLAGDSETERRSPSDTPSPTPEPTPEPTPADPDTLTSWERSTACDAMHDSAIKVDAVARRVDDDYVPIRFSTLSTGERDILRVVTSEGGFATCEVSAAFQRFVERVSDAVAEQDGTMQVFLERGGRFYRLYVEKRDQVFAY